VFRKLFFRRLRLLAGAGVLSLFAAVLGFAVYNRGETRQPQRSDELSQQLAMDPRTAAIFSHSCADCHSNRTTWPWYSHVPPVSWLIQHDVDQARKDFNASLWSSYSSGEKREILEDIARVVTNREMPIRQYLLLHRSARLSDRSGELLVQWARGQRRLLRKMDADESGAESPAEGGVR
jgi:hypothetical protein